MPSSRFNAVPVDGLWGKSILEGIDRMISSSEPTNNGRCEFLPLGSVHFRIPGSNIRSLIGWRASKVPRSKTNILVSSIGAQGSSVITSV